MWFKEFILKYLAGADVKERVLELMKDASLFVSLKGTEKKAYVIDKIVAYQQHYFGDKIKFLSKERQVIILTSILSLVIEELYKRYFKNQSI